LQTGDALQKRLRLEDDDLAVLIGSQAVRDLHYIKDDDSSGFMASESEENLFSDTEHVRYEGTIYDGYLNRWLERSPKLQKLVSAPILVSTIDYLMPATESSRGGKQIAPMLRLLTSDLVLDEPDDFGLDDMYALTRLVHWAGLLGSRVLISSATLPPSLVKGLFDAYLAGRKVFQMGCGVPGRPLSVCCAWFDENGVDQCDCSALETFSERHSGFVSKRVKKLKTAQPLRKARIVPVDSTSRSAEDVVDAFQKAVHKGILELHSKHAVSYPQIDKNISIGLVRMANINPMVAVAQRLFEIESPDNYHIHYCVYHSQFPLAVRSTIEKQLDSALTRHPLDSLLDISSIRNVLMKYPEQNHIFVVVATPVAEVGRDHDYDWAIAEPSSMRSIIQLAGRVQRHRCKEPATENMLILSHNFKGLRMDSFDGAVFNKPGFESGGFKLKSHSLNDLLEATQVDVIDAIPRIQERVPLKEDENLADLEHTHIAAMIYGLDRIPVHASLWWKHDAHWSYELQRRKPFRLSCPDEEYVLLSEDGDEPLLNLVDKDGNFNLSEKCFKRVAVTFSKGVSMWGPIDVLQIFNDLAEQFDEDVGNVSQKFGVMRLRKTEELWNYNSNLGVFKGLT
jgi:CRISPR-associated endonuclease/helicase Cas3